MIIYENQLSGMLPFLKIIIIKNQLSGDLIIICSWRVLAARVNRISLELKAAEGRALFISVNHNLK